MGKLKKISKIEAPGVKAETKKGEGEADIVTDVSFPTKKVKHHKSLPPQSISADDFPEDKAASEEKARDPVRADKPSTKSNRRALPASSADRSHMRKHTTAVSKGAVCDLAAANGVNGDVALTGMKKWLAEYRAKRPGLTALQAQVDAFMADYEAREEKALQEKIAAAEEDGWTLVVGHKGRKMTTDSQSGVRVGAVSTTAAAAKATKKSKKDSFLDFYRFQKRESRRSEVLELQQKFLDDKARIARMRDARKFRPY